MKTRIASRGRHAETAGHHLTAGVPRVAPEDSVRQVRAHLGGQRFDSVELLCVVDRTGVLRGVVPIGELLAAAPDARMAQLMRELPAVTPDVDQEKVASLALHHALGAVPVVDHAGRLLGVVPSVALLHILRREHVEDLHRLAGIRRETTRAREAIEAPPLRRARDRLPWLVIGLIGSMLATLVVASFEEALQAHVAIAFFVPGLVYLADAIGTQTEAVAVRGLSLSHAGLARLVGGELRTGFVLGLMLCIVTAPLIWLVFNDWRLAAAVAGALFCAAAMATTIGLLLPWLIATLGGDPAYGSGPLATIIQDVLSLLIYFAIVTVFLA